MMQAIRLFLLLEAATFVVAALIHPGYIMAGYIHARAHVAESIIASVLFGGLLLSLFVGEWTRRIGIVVQGFAILGILAGTITISVGVGPRTVPDIAYHIAMLGVLVTGLLLAKRAPDSAMESTTGSGL